MSAQLVQGYGITKYMNIMNIYMCVSMSRKTALRSLLMMLLCITLMPLGVATALAKAWFTILSML